MFFCFFFVLMKKKKEIKAKVRHELCCKKMYPLRYKYLNTVKDKLALNCSLICGINGSPGKGFKVSCNVKKKL